MPLLRLGSTLALAALFAVPCVAQYTVKHLVFKGGQPYPQEGLEAASGLKQGQKIGQKEMSDAAQRIMDTGAFSDIEMTLSGPAAGIDVIFKLKPQTRPTCCRFRSTTSCGSRRKSAPRG